MEGELTPDRTALLQRLPGLYLFTVVEGEYRNEYSFATVSGQLVRKRKLKGQKGELKAQG